MKKIIIAIVTIGVLAVGHFIYQEFLAHQRAYYSILSESQATELTATSSAEKPSESSQYSKWVGDWVPEKGLELDTPFCLHVELDSSGLPTYEVRFLTGYHRKRTITVMKLLEMLDLSSPKRRHALGDVPSELTFEIVLTYNPESDTMEWIGTKFGNGQIISEKKVVLVRREQSELAENNIPFKLKRVKADMRSMATGLESYLIDNSAYPAWVLGNHPLAFNKAAAIRDMPSFRLGVTMRAQKGSQELVPRTITTPIAYIVEYFEDPFQLSPTDPQPTFVYFADINGWILVSPGPDGDYDIDPEQDYQPNITQPSEDILLKGYDPTNGLMSNGDVFRVKQ